MGRSKAEVAKLFEDFRYEMLNNLSLLRVDEGRLLDGKEGSFFVAGMVKDQTLVHAQIPKDVAANPGKNLAGKFDAWRVYRVTRMEYPSGPKLSEQLIASSEQQKAEKREKQHA